MGLNAAINATVFAGGVKDSVNNMGKEMSPHIGNEYDKTLGNNVVKVKEDFMGNTNKLNGGKNNNIVEAASYIEQMYQEKLAFEERQQFRKPNTFQRNRFDNKNFGDRGNQKRTHDSGFGGRGEGYQEITYPIVSNNPNVGPYGDSVINKQQNKVDYLPYAVVGSMAVGLGAYQAIKKHNISAPLGDVGRNIWPSIRKGLYAAPKKFIQSLPGGKITLKALKDAEKEVASLEKKTAPRVNRGRRMGAEIQGEMYSQNAQQAVDQLNNNYNATSQFNEFKQAYVDDFEDVEKIAYAHFENNKHYFKTLVKEDFLQNGIKSIPYVVAPLALSQAVNRNLKTDGSKIRTKDSVDLGGDRIVIDVPLNGLSGVEKKAYEAGELARETVKNVEHVSEKFNGRVPYETQPWGNFFKHELGRSAVKGLSYAVFPTAAVLLTKRDLRGVGESVDGNYEDHGPVKPGMARVTIEKGHDKRIGHGYDKMAKDLLDTMYKQATIGDATSAIEKSMEKTIKQSDLTSPKGKQLTDAYKRMMSYTPVNGKKLEKRMLK